jgi:hypothetical protein
MGYERKDFGYYLLVILMTTVMFFPEYILAAAYDFIK